LAQGCLLLHCILILWMDGVTVQNYGTFQNR
jgi:hypothetical protein